MSFAGRIVSMLAIIASAAVCCASQQPLPPAADQVQRATVDETFELNIVERRITEKDFYAATSVGFVGHQGKKLSLNVGVEVRAEKIDVLMRNVTGTVRFRGSIQKILDLVNSRPTRPPR